MVEGDTYICKPQTLSYQNKEDFKLKCTRAYFGNYHWFMKYGTNYM